MLVKANAIELLRKELVSKRVKGPVGLGSMNDPYMSLEREVELTRHALSVIAEFRFPVHIVTKSDLVLRDLVLLRRISESYAAISFTVTTADDELGKKVEPGAPLVSARFRAMNASSKLLSFLSIFQVERWRRPVRLAVYGIMDQRQPVQV